MEVLVGFALVLLPYLVQGAIEDQYVDCIRDKATRAMPAYATSGTTMTPGYCINLCKSKGFMYAGVQNGAECWCDNFYDKYGPSHNCDVSCSGDPKQTCGGAWALSVYWTSAIENEYIGCMRDGPTRAMPAYSTHSSLMTPRFCVNICYSKGYKYAGVQYMRECWCDNTNDKYGPADNCNLPCWGDESSVCGGAYALSVYKTRARTIDQQYIGCMRDGPTRAMTGFATHTSHMTPQFCVNLCNSKGYKYAGLQYRGECYCDNVYDKHGPADNCNLRCNGDGSFVCGGAYALSVYKTK